MTALDRLGLRAGGRGAGRGGRGRGGGAGVGEGGRRAAGGAGGGDVSVALAEIVGRDGRVYAIDSDPAARDQVAEVAAASSQVVAITQSGEERVLLQAGRE